MSIEVIEKLGAMQFTIADAEKCLGRSIATNDERAAYERGRLSAVSDVRQSMLTMARSGDAVAQKQFLDLSLELSATIPRDNQGRSDQWWQTLETMCKHGVPRDDLAFALKVELPELDAACLTAYNMTFAEYHKHSDMRGRAELRSKIYSEAMRGNTAMLVYLGKSVLGLREDMRNGEPTTSSHVYTLNITDRDTVTAATITEPAK